MVKVLLFTLGVIAAALGLAWLADRPGTVTIEWLGYQIETSAFVGTIAVIAIAGLLVLVWALLRYLLTRPAAIATSMRERRKQQRMEALSHGLLAIGVGDRSLAQRYAAIAGRTLPTSRLPRCSRRRRHNSRATRRRRATHSRRCAESPETQILGLRGLFLEAKRATTSMPRGASRKRL